MTQQDAQLELEILEFAESRGVNPGGWDRPAVLTEVTEVPWELVGRRLLEQRMLTGILTPFSFGGTLEYRRLFGADRLHVGQITDRGRTRLAELRKGSVQRAPL